MKSFVLYTDEDRYKTQAFVSFKTDPDEPLASEVASWVRGHGCEVTYIHGDSVCPFPFGSAEAMKWIRKLLNEKTGENRVLLSIASEHSLRSEWVFEEFFTSTQVSKLVILLWFSGPDPTNYFYPPPRLLTHRLPSCPVYLLDCRSSRTESLEKVTDVLKALPVMRRNLFARQSLVVALAAALVIIPVVYLAMHIKGAKTEVALNAEKLQGLADWWMLIMVAATTAFAPMSIRIPRRLRSDKLTLLVSGFSSFRYTILLLLTLFAFRLFSMGAIPWAVAGTICVIVIHLTDRALRRHLIRRAYDHAQGSVEPR